MMDPHFAYGFFSELTKEAYKVDERALNERLRVGAGPLWSIGGGLAGMTLTRKLLRDHGSKAFWPLAVAAALSAGAAHKMYKNVAEGGGSPEQEIAERALRGPNVGRPAAG